MKWVFEEIFRDASFDLILYFLHCEYGEENIITLPADTFRCVLTQIVG